MAVEIPSFETKEELFDFLVANKQTLIAEKCYQVKRADAVVHYVGVMNGKDESTSKADGSVSLVSADSMKVVLVINTTKVMDSHKDVHIDGIWTKSLQESKGLYLLQEHSMSFKGIISDEVKAVAKKMPWADLGFSFEGNTQALIFNATLQKQRNPYMFDQYARGYVKNHSVGMRYVKMVLCIDNENWGAEKEAWDKYFPMVANKEAAEESGWFWAITEAKVIEGSAVPMGSNFATPTLSATPKNIEPGAPTQQQEPPEGTQKSKSSYYHLIH